MTRQLPNEVATDCQSGFVPALQEMSVLFWAELRHSMAAAMASVTAAVQLCHPKNDSPQSQK